jgi:hypothetical protein
MLVTAGATGPVRAADPPKPAELRKYPTFTDGRYTLAVMQMEATTKKDLAPRGEHEYELELSGRIILPEREDVVAVTKQLEVVNVKDTRSEDILVRKDRQTRRSDDYDSGTFGPAEKGSAEVETDGLRLARNAYRIHTVTVEAQAVIAKRRDGKRVAAVVMEESSEFLSGMTIRITSLRLDKGGELTVMAHCTRPTGGPTGPFIESVSALADDGTVLGEARWSKGDPFDKVETLTARLTLPGGQTHKYLRFTAVTDYEVERLTFEIQDLFQD